VPQPLTPSAAHMYHTFLKIPSKINLLQRQFWEFEKEFTPERIVENFL